MTKRYLGNIITQNPTAPAGDLTNSAAKGVWSLEEQLAYQKAGLWPVPGNFPLDVEDVFSTYLYEGNGSTQTITNGIDLAGEGGLVWSKGRSQASFHNLFDTERGASKQLEINTDAELTNSAGINSFNSNGYTMGSWGGVNNSSTDYASWTFRKAPKFLDIVTYTGDGVDNRTIAHNLGSVPGMIIVKATSHADQWPVYHRSLGTGAVRLNLTNSYNSANIWWKTTPTDSAFTVYGGGEVNVSSVNYVAYLFAHNDGDGGFGPDGDADIIKCGSFTTDGSGNFSVDLGFEPEFFLTKRTDAVQNWYIWDTMRGWTVSGLANGLVPNASSAELNYFGGTDYFHPTASGIEGSGNFFGTNANVIYMAISRGTKVPESGTEVFDVEFGSASPTPWFKSGFPVDFGFFKNRDATGNWQSGSRLTQGKSLNPNLTQAEETATSTRFDYQNGWYNNFGASTSWLSWMWKRAPGFLDVVAYEGNSTAGLTVSHNLGVAPEMIWLKDRDATNNWVVYAEPIGNAGGLYLNSDVSFVSTSSFWNSTSPTTSDFTLGSSSQVNSSRSYIAYLFASLPGISKVGSASHSGTTNVDCGFTSGARFVLLKRTDASGDWYVWDSERGIVSGNDPYLLLNTTAAEVTNTDYIDPLSSGFTITSSFTAGTYIFYAIA